ncbi:MAG: hypothetical protein PHD11_08720 [Bacteroidales bacterium]|nr:hypothetical protein [Bacteroidales bacterium]MDD4670993.1 hypothetical protein [Bacteroidales bacterium]
MKRFFILSSLLLLFLAGCSVQHKVVPAGNDVPSQKYKMEVVFPKGEISGIMAFKRAGGNMYGTAVNEFGVKVFDFVLTGGKRCKLKNVTGFLNKWYIRRTISKDLPELLNMDFAEDALEYVNYRQNIKYKLILIKE